MSKTKKGDKVKVHYTGYLKDGTVFDSTVKKDPLIFTIGEGIAVPGIEKTVIGMSEGNVKAVQVQPEDAYGEHKSNLVTVIDREKISGNIDLQMGMKLKARTSVGIMKEVTVCNVSDTSITVDANHPLADQELTFEIVLLEIMEK